MSTVYVNKLNNPGESLEFRMEIPEDFHWEDLKQHKFFGEIYCNREGKYYSRNCGRAYRPKSEQKHLDEGHFQGYSFGVEHFSPVGGIVLDPFVGSGTTMIESYLQGRNSIGVEVEFNQLLQDNLEHIKKSYPREAFTKVLHGDCREVLPTLEDKLDLVITGFPYPIISGNITSDAPMNPKKDSEKGFETNNYNAEKSLGILHWKRDFRPEMTKTLTAATKNLKVGGKFITLIKDCIQNKQPFLLQKFVMGDFLEANPNFKILGWYIHRHTPETMFMRTYSKRFPEVKVPYYQVGVVLEKIS